MPSYETEIIKQFIENPQNTHRAVIANSVGMAILFLKKTYLKETYIEADIIEKYAHCIEAMKLVVKDNHKRQLGVDFVISASTEALNEYDQVHLYLPDNQDTNGTTYKKQTHTVSLTHAIPLIWLALNDHEKFAHDINYPALSKDQQFTRARGDYNKRLDNFFSLLIDLRNNNLCHQGIRNEIVFLLNKIYFGMEVIEDDLSTIAATLKDHTNNLFWRHYHNAATPEIKTTLTATLFIWMSTYNPKPLLAQVDPENKANAALHDLFIRHGSDPVEMKLDQLIDECLPTLNFTYDSQQYPVIRLIENIFNSTEEKAEIKRSLENIQAWIMAHVALDNTQNTENIARFFTLYQAYKSFDQRIQMLLNVTGTMQDNYHEVSRGAEAYFSAIANANLNQEFPIASEELLIGARQLKLHIEKFRSTNMMGQIENFLARWSAVREDFSSAKYLYRLFIEVELFQEKVILKDEEIDAFWNVVDKSTPFRDITVYLINRIFLHAIIIEPKDWSCKFAAYFYSTLEFVKNNFNNFSSGNHLNKNLAETSYPPLLLKQLDHLKKRHEKTLESNQGDEPVEDNEHSHDEHYLFLPHQIKAACQWSLLVHWLSEEKLLEIFQPQAVRFIKLVSDWLIKNKNMVTQGFLETALGIVPYDYRSVLFKDPEVIDVIVVGFKFRIPDLVKLINGMIPAAERINIWKSLEKLLVDDLNFYESYVGRNAIISALESLPADDRLNFLNIFSLPNVKNSLLDPVYFDSWVESLSGADLLTYLTQLDVNILFEKFRSNEAGTQSRFKDKLPLPQRIELLRHLSSKFTSELYQAEALFLIVFIKISFVTASIKLLNYLSIVEDTVDLTKLSTDFDYWQTTFKNIPAEKRLGFLVIFGNTQLLFRQNPYLTVIADNLTANEFYFYAIARTRRPLLKSYLENNPSMCISLLINKLPESTRCEVLSYTYDGRIAAQSNLLAILKTLPISENGSKL
jgi:hypothetical protein